MNICEKHSKQIEALQEEIAKILLKLAVGSGYIVEAQDGLKKT